MEITRSEKPVSIKDRLKWARIFHWAHIYTSNTVAIGGYWEADLRVSWRYHLALMVRRQIPHGRGKVGLSS